MRSSGFDFGSLRLGPSFSTSSLLLWGCISLFLTCSSCGKGDEQQLEVAGSSTVLPIVSRAAERFSSRDSAFQVIVNGGGSGVGIQQLLQKNIDIGMSSRDLTDTEKAKASEPAPEKHVIGKDIVVPVVSAPVKKEGIERIRMAELRKIYKGAIDNWKALGGPDRKILCIDKEASRGTRHVFMEALFGDPKAKAPGADLVLGSNNEEQSAIAQSDAALGMLSIAWKNEKVRGLTLIDGTGDTLPPSRSRLKGKGYPFARELYLITLGPPDEKEARFIRFIKRKKGQRIVEENGYVPLAS